LFEQVLGICGEGMSSSLLLLEESEPINDVDSLSSSSDKTVVGLFLFPDKAALFIVEIRALIALIPLSVSVSNLAHSCRNFSG
jgi:hypothetical protein